MKTNESLLEAFAAVRAALLANDVDALGKLVAYNYCGFDPTGGKHDRELLLQAYGAGGVQLDSYDTSELTTRIMGDAGLVMGVGSLRGSYGEQQFQHKLRFLDVYVHRGTWQLVVSQVTEITTAS